MEERGGIFPLFSDDRNEREGDWEFFPLVESRQIRSVGGGAHGRGAVEGT